MSTAEKHDDTAGAVCNCHSLSKTDVRRLERLRLAQHQGQMTIGGWACFAKNLDADGPDGP